MRSPVRMMTATTLVGVLLAAGSMFILTKPAAALPVQSPQFFAAQSTPSSGGGTSSKKCEKPKLLGIFIPWYQYLDLAKDDTGSCSVKDFHLLPDGGKSDLPLVLLAIVDDLLRLAGLVAVVYVIYGGIQYSTSQGSPEATSKAQSTILNALIGLVIALVAVTFVTFLGRALS